MNMDKLLFFLQGKPKFCPLCGNKLEVEEEMTNFNVHTGYPSKVSVHTFCVNYGRKYVGTLIIGNIPEYEPNGHSNFVWERDLTTEEKKKARIK